MKSRQFAIDKKQISGSEQMKIQTIVLNQLGKGFQKQPPTYLKGDFILREFNCRQLGLNLWKVVT